MIDLWLLYHKHSNMKAKIVNTKKMPIVKCKQSVSHGAFEKLYTSYRGFKYINFYTRHKTKTNMLTKYSRLNLQKTETIILNCIFASLNYSCHYFRMGFRNWCQLLVIRSKIRYVIKTTSRCSMLAKQSENIKPKLQCCCIVHRVLGVNAIVRRKGATGRERLKRVRWVKFCEVSPRWHEIGREKGKSRKDVEIEYNNKDREEKCSLRIEVPTIYNCYCSSYNLS